MGAIEQVQDAWRIAAKEFDLDFIAPVAIEESGACVHYHGFVRDFGSAQGTVFIVSEIFDEDLGPASRLAKQKGFFFSCINAAIYRTFDREVFLEALRDWGWSRVDREQPEWLSKQ